MDYTKEKGVRNKLCLKQKNSNSLQNALNVKLTNDPKHEDFKEENCINEQVLDNQNKLLSSSNNDSLEDFKSPKAKTKPKTDLNQFKFKNDKEKKKIEKTKNKFNTKPKKNNVDINQTLIESSLVKPQTSKQNDMIESIPCPLCLKAFKDDITCSNHMKICATKNNISTNQLLVAMQLQSRQAKERKDMGLLAAPIVPDRKKQFRTKNYSTEDDPALQLALAMSESLYQAEQVAELKQTALLAGIPSQYIKELSTEECKATLKSFGFTTNKTADPPRSKKRKFHGPTILQSRSKEDKDRVLTERIACILTGDDAFTQVLKHSEILNEKRPTVLRSKNLRQIEVLSKKLWDRSRLTKKCDDFYVKELKSQILKTNQKLQEPVSTDSELQLHHENEESDANIDLLDFSVAYDPTSIDALDPNDSQINSKIDSQRTNEMKSMDYEHKLIKTIVSNWRDILNDRNTSDIMIFVKDNKLIYAHKLVFHVQCSNILLDVEKVNSDNSSEMKTKICWLDKDELSALAFLEFIYCGSIDKNVSIFDHASLILQIENLAVLYEVKDLFIYIRRKANYLATKRLNEKNSVINIANETRIHNNSSETQLTQTINFSKIDSSDSMTVKQLEFDNTNRNISKEDYSDKRITLSPELFASESEDENLHLNKAEKHDHIEINKYNTKSPVLVNQINLHENTQYMEMHDIEDKLSNHECSDSQQTVVNLSGFSSPESDKSSVSPNDRNLHEQLTPKSKKSSTIHNDVTPKKLNYDNTEIMKMIDIKSEESLRNDDEIFSREPQYEENDLSEHINISNNASLKDGNIVTDDTISCETEDDSLHNAVTPPKSDIQDYKLTRNNLDKIKTNLSLFIEKVQRENAKSISESISDIETPDFQIKHRNPFIKADQHDSYGYLRNDGPKNQNEKNCKQKRRISLLERDVLEEECKKSHKLSKNTVASSDQSSNLNFSPHFIDKLQNDIDSNINETSCPSFSKTNDSYFDLTQNNMLKSSFKNNNEKDTDISTPRSESKDVTDDEIEISRYSKYKKTNKHNNSIKKYRDQIIHKLNENNDNKYGKKENYHNTPADMSANIKSQKNDILKSNRIIEDITLVSESEDDEQNNVKSKESKKKECNQQCLDPEVKPNNETNFSLDSKIYDAEDNTMPLDLFKNQSQKPKISNTTNSCTSKSNSDNKVIDLSLDSDEEPVYNKNPLGHNMRVETVNLSKNQNTKNKEMDFRIEGQISNDAEEKNSKIVDLSPEFNKIDNNLQSKSMSNEKLNKSGDTIDDNKSEDNECRVINLSPISIISSPEHYEFNKRARNSPVGELNNKTKTNESKIDCEYIDDLEYNDDWITRFSEKDNTCNSKRRLSSENIYSKNKSSPKSNFMLSESSASQNLRISSLISSPILNENAHYSQALSSKSSKVNRHNNNKNESSDHAVPGSRKLKIKSASAMNFIERELKSNKSSFQKSASFVTPEQNRKEFRKSNIPENDITPPLNYSVLGTPDLHKELKKFGLKPQSRNKAKILLRHIYNETHPALSSKKRTSSCNSSSEDKEPPSKKQHIEKSDKKSPSKKKNVLESGQDSENCPLIAEEMDYDDHDTASTSDNIANIKDVFLKLIETNKDMYNKVLTYEPLSLESLHSLIKQNGLKINMNGLMNFLDEQCITFQVQNSNGSRTKKKRNQKDD